MFKIIIMLISIQFLGSIVANSHPVDLSFDHITIEDGLPSNVIYHILQDQKGFMWFATNDGLCRFDGCSIKEYKYNAMDPTSISSNWCSEIFEDRAGNLWIGTAYGGLNIYDPATETFTRLMHQPNNDSSINYNVVFGICEDDSGTFWLGTWNGLDKLKIKKNSLTHAETFEIVHFQNDTNNINSLSDNRIWHLCLDDNHSLWISTHENGLDHFDIESETFKNYQYDPHDQNSISDNHVRYVYQDPLGNGDILWIATLNGLNRFNKRTEKFTRFYHEPNNSNSLSSNVILHIFRDSMDRLWIGTKKGLNMLDEDNKKLYKYQHDPLNRKSLNNDWVFSMCEDRNGNLWFGTIEGGVNKTSIHEKNFEVFDGVSNKSKYPQFRDIFSIYEDGDGIIWLGTAKGLYRFNRESMEIKHFKHDPEDQNSLSYLEVYAIYQDTYYDDKTLWVACYGGGLDRLTFKKKMNTGEESVYFDHFKPIFNDTTSISSIWVDKIYKDRSGKLWISTREGLNQFIYDKEIFKHYFHDPGNPNSISHDRTTVIYQSPFDEANILWIGTEGGLNKLNTDKNVFYHYKHDPHDPYSLNHDFIWSLCADNKSHGTILWVGTFSGGLNKLDIENGRFEHFTEDDGISNNSICSIVMDNYGYLWISTRKGLSKFTPQTETFKNYTNEDGILEGITYPGSFFESKRGEVFIGCGRGFIAFYPDSIIHNMQPPKIVITDFKVFNKSVKLPKSIVMLDKIELSHEQNFFSFEFSALDYTNPEMNQYAYKLTGIQKEWVYSGSRRYANYTNINPGKYTFQVIGANYEGAWSDSGASIKISVMPPYWMTSWFKMLLAFIFVTGIIALYKIRVSILKREKHIQQAFSRRLIEEIEKGRKRIAGELHDSLGQNLLFIKNEMQQIIGKLSNTNRAKDDLMNVSSLVSESINEIREISTNLHPHQLDRLGLKNAIESMARKFMHSIRIKILTDIDDLGKFAYETTEIHIFRIVQEALTNIIKHANATEVTITIKKKIKYSYISVKDNGVGFNYTKDQTENSIAKGFGLTGIAERVKILNGKLIIKSSENSGTDIQVIIPLK